MKTQSQKPRRVAVAAIAASLAALAVAGPAQADLHAGLTNGGCLSGIQVGHVTHSNGDVTPICRTID